MGKALKLKKRNRKNHANQVKTRKRVEATAKLINKLQAENAANTFNRTDQHIKHKE
jgi:hypothetical protein